MSFGRHEEIYRPIRGSQTHPERSPHRPDRPGWDRHDEFPAGYSLAGCAPAVPASASPAGAQVATEGAGSTIETQRTANHLLTACLNGGDNPTRI
jgi:hypothetical protein